MKKVNKNRTLGSKGFTLVEVLVSLMILFMASQMLLLGITFVTKAEERTIKIEMARREIGEHLADHAECIEGTVRLNMEELCDDIESEGILYTGEEYMLPMEFSVIWVEEGEYLPEEDEQSEEVAE